ncbi:response regulator [Rheinheimera sp. NSM]|uniref:response regulator n=1 Tax=Rheinheimera sp. NSM TaxID=3457884 RepID=UPI0040360D61
MRQYLLCVMLLWFSGLLHADVVQLFSRSSTDNIVVTLAEAEQHWLSQKQALVFGVIAKDNPPFAMINNNDEYEGITADYLGLISFATRLPIKINTYPSKAALTAALLAGEIDFFSYSGQHDLYAPDVVSSIAYADDIPVVVQPKQQQNPPAAGLKIAYSEHYLDGTLLQQHFQQPVLMPYSSPQEAIEATAFGQADLYIGNIITAHYLLHINHLQDLEIANFTPLASGEFNFYVNSKAPLLLSSINKILQHISFKRQKILQRWSAGRTIYMLENPLVFSAQEQQFLAANPRLNLVIMPQNAPFLYADKQGHYTGLVQDFLAIVSSRTGLDFNIVEANSLQDMLAMLQDGRADLAATLAPTEGRQQQLLFTRPFFVTSYVLVNRLDKPATLSLNDLNAKTLAILNGHATQRYIELTYPDIKLLKVDNVAQAYDALLSGQADAMVNDLFSARYYLQRYFSEQLRITSSFKPAHSRFTLSMPHRHAMLHSILDKTIISIPPEKLAQLSLQWGRRAEESPISWKNYQTEIQIASVLAAVLISGFMLWNFILRKQIVARRQVEQALQEQLKFVRVLIDSTPYPIYVRDNQQGRLLLCNQAYLNFFNVTAAQVTGKTLAESNMLNTADTDRYQNLYKEAAQSSSGLFADRNIQVGEQLYRVYHWTVPHHNVNGELVGVIGGWIDISERQRLLDAVQAAKDEAEQASKAKSAFLATMSHEIRTPLHAVIGTLELAKHKAETGQWDFEAIDIAYDSAQGLKELIGDILDIAKIEAGKLELYNQSCNLADETQRVYKVFIGVARQKGLYLKLDIAPQLQQLRVMSDPGRVRQVLANLLSNAVKFTASGGITLSLQLLAQTNDQLSVRLSVEDTGVGIAEHELAKLMQPFSQTASAQAVAVRGTGLGLSICRAIVQLMQGDITIDSTQGQGTSVSVTLSLTMAAAVSGDDTGAAISLLPTDINVAPLRLLVVDDHDVNRMLLARQLSYLSHQVWQAADGRQALQLLQQVTVDVVITDCNMPVMDGYQLVRQIRQSQQLCQLPVLGLTASAEQQDRNRCIDAGMNDCLFKPVSMAQLQQALMPYVSADNAVFSLQKLHKLAQGDSDFAREMLTEMCKSNVADSTALTQAIQLDDADSIARLAHKIKGAMLLIDATVLVQLCISIEQAVAADRIALGRQLLMALDNFNQQAKAQLS